MIVTSGIRPAALEDLAPPLAPAEVDRLADEIAEVASLIDAAEHRLLTLIRRFDEGSGWATHGALSCVHWLNWRIGLDLGAARERVRVSHALATLPLVDDALRRGAISYSKVRAITRVASPATEATLLEMATHATASQLERICRSYRRAVDDSDVERPASLADEERSRFVRVRETDDGMVRIEARLRPEEAAVVLQALDVARRRAWHTGAAHVAGPFVPQISAETSPLARRADERHHREPTPALSRADALVVVAESWLSSVAASDENRDAAGLPVELVVHVDQATFTAGGDAPDYRNTPDAAGLAPHATLADGTPISVATASRHACVARSACATTAAASPAARIGSPMRTTSSPGSTAARPRSRTCSPSAADTTASSTSTATASSPKTPESHDSLLLTVDPCRSRTRHCG